MPSYLLTTKRPSCSASKTRIRRGFSPFSEVLVFLIAAGRSLLEIIVVLNDRPDCDARDWWQSEALHHCPCRKPYPAWQSIENRTMIACNEGSLQAHWLDGCGSDPVAGNA